MTTRPAGWEKRMADTRAEIVERALQLFFERGFDDVTIADIAAAAATSPRTIHRYFPTKQDIVLEPSEFTEFVAALYALPRDVPPLDALAAALRQVSPDPALVPIEAQRVELIVTTPSLERAWTDSLAVLERALCEWFADRTDRSSDDFELRAAAAAVIAVHRLLVSTWTRVSFEQYHDLAERGLRLVADGFSGVLTVDPRP